MTEAEESQQEEPDTPSEEVIANGMRELVDRAIRIVDLEEDAAGIEKAIRKEKAELVPLMREGGLHGIALSDGVKVRRRWSSNRPTIDPVKLATECADARDFIKVEVKVDQGMLKTAYPDLWRRFGGKSTEGIRVDMPKERK